MASGQRFLCDRCGAGLSARRALARHQLRFHVEWTRRICERPDQEPELKNERSDDVVPGGLSGEEFLQNIGPPAPSYNNDGPSVVSPMLFSNPEALSPLGHRSGMAPPPPSPVFDAVKEGSSLWDLDARVSLEVDMGQHIATAGGNDNRTPSPLSFDIDDLLNDEGQRSLLPLLGAEPISLNFGDVLGQVEQEIGNPRPRWDDGYPPASLGNWTPGDGLFCTGWNDVPGQIDNRSEAYDLPFWNQPTQFTLEQVQEIVAQGRWILPQETSQEFMERMRARISSCSESVLREVFRQVVNSEAAVPDLPEGHPYFGDPDNVLVIAPFERVDNSG